MSARSAAVALYVLASTVVSQQGCAGGDSEDGKPVDVVVYAKKVTFLGTDTSRIIDTAVIDGIRNHRAVARAIGRMELNASARAKKMMRKTPSAAPIPIEWEVGGFCDGVAESVMEAEPWAHSFKDWGAAANKRPPKPCRASLANSCEARYYCDARTRTCQHRVPVVISPILIKMYNDSFADKHALPKIDSAAAVLDLSRFSFDIQLGASMVPAATTRNTAAKKRTVGTIVIGVSKHARPIGMTIPLGYVKRWNTELKGKRAMYGSINVTLKSKKSLAAFKKWLTKSYHLLVRMPKTGLPPR